MIKHLKGFIEAANSFKNSPSEQSGIILMPLILLKENGNI